MLREKRGWGGHGMRPVTRVRQSAESGKWQKTQEDLAGRSSHRAYSDIDKMLTLCTPTAESTRGCASLGPSFRDFRGKAGVAWSRVPGAPARGACDIER